MPSETRADECLAKLDLQFLRLPIVRRNVSVERLPNGTERLLDGVENGRTVASVIEW